MMAWLRNIVLLAAGAVAGRRMSKRATTVSEEPGPEPRRWRWWLARAGIAIVVLGIAGFLVAASGVIPLRASSGHWAITEWILEFSKARSVSTHSLGVSVPALDDPALVMKGAGHFESGCMPCHGSLATPRPRVAEAMLPHPPSLARAASEWKDRELFYIVKHGLKFTGMPAWPAQKRDDEVWAVVAFLKELGEMDAAAYQALVTEPESARPARGETADTLRTDTMTELVQPRSAPATVATSCGRCHGTDGGGRATSAFPKLAGQRPGYLNAALYAYARGRRHSGIMQPIAAAMSDEEMREVSGYYAQLSPAPAVSSADTDTSSVARGFLLATYGDPREGIPACRECHGPVPTRRNPFYPKLAGQYADYLVLQLRLFQEGNRGGSRFAHLMKRTAERLTEQQMRDVAAYYASLSGTE